MISKAATYIVATIVFIIALLLTVSLAYVINTQHIPLNSIGVWMCATVPASMYAICVAMLMSVRQRS